MCDPISDIVRSESCCAHTQNNAHSDDGAFRVTLEYSPENGRLLCRESNTERPLMELSEAETQRLFDLDMDDSSLIQVLSNILSQMDIDDQTATPAQVLVPTSYNDPGFDTVEKKGRPKLWDLPHNLHCPVIGTCLDVAELRKIAKKAGATSAEPLDDYQVHVSFVSTCEEKNALTLAAHKALEKKYAAYVRRFAKAKTPEQLGELWQDAVARGEVPGAFWATLTHPKCNKALRMRTYEEVHMLSHQIGAGQRADLKRLSETENELRHLKREFESLYSRTRTQLEDRELRIHELEAKLAETEEQLRRSHTREEELHTQVREFKERLSEDRIQEMERHAQQQLRRLANAEQAAIEWQVKYRTNQDRTTQLQEHLQDKEAECQALERILKQSLSSCSACVEEDCSQCPDLRGQRILCVGGRNQLLGHYRALVSRCNGEFDHHDGGLEDNRARLDAMLASADAVLCPTDCVSHDAYYRLKKACKKHNKPHLFLASSGISTFARAIETIAPL